MQRGEHKRCRWCCGKVLEKIECLNMKASEINVNIKSADEITKDKWVIKLARNYFRLKGRQI